MKRLTRITLSLSLALGLTVALMLVLNGRPVRADTITVDTIADNTAGGDGYCTLREAINNANTDSDTTSGDCTAGNGDDSIIFSDTLFSAGGIISITQGPLVIQSDNGTSIDGDLDDDGEPEVEIRYSSGTVNTGLIIVQSSDNRIEGLSVTDSPNIGIYVDGNGDQADNNQIVNNWIGLDLTAADRGNSSRGIYIWHVAGSGSGAAGNTIQDNVISGNGSDGLYINDAPETQVLSNTIGLNPAITDTIANGDDGIVLNGAVTTTIQDNWISGNGGDGLYITATQDITITDNVIGLDATGSVATNYGLAGINVAANSTLLVIRDNTVSGNRYNGIYLGPDCSYATIAGNYIGANSAGTVGLGNGRFTNRDGIQLNDAYSNTIGGPNLADRNIIVHNGRAGVFISGEQADHNVVQNNYIGAGATGSEDLGNGDYGPTSDSGAGGVYVYDGADHNIIRDNLIRFNYIGLRFSGGSDPLVTPPQYNQVLTNTLTYNDKYGIVNQTTHQNAAYTTPVSGDNLIQNNVITGTGEGCGHTWCSGFGIYNYGGSPRIISNTISENDGFSISGEDHGYGIVNRVYFGTDGPDDAADDLLSMPYIAGNTISSNENDGIQSRDTAPLNKATLLNDNTFVNNSGEPHISQRWFVAVEVVSGTQTIDSGLAVTITRQSGGDACPGGACVGNDFDSAGGGNGVWGPSGIVYTDVENLNEGTTTWFEVIEYEVEWDGDWVTYTSHLVEAGGAEHGSRYFDFNGITTTDEISGDVNLPFCVSTGITGTNQSLCRYQIAQIDVFGSFGDGDWDDDGIPDEDEGTDDTDGDGTPDYKDTDSDNDGIPDDEEYDWCGSAPCDSDGDGTPDYKDTDSDNDGIPDSVEGNTDTDGDGIPDYADTDSDNDGIPDSVEGNVDSDGDGTPDYKDTDSDGDGIADSAEGAGDTDGDGDENFRDTDSDGDGDPDNTDPDDDNDGIPDTVEGLVDNPGVDNDSSIDTDGDGLPDYLDTDSDNDGVPDSEEAGADPNNPVDSDKDNTPDYQDTDSDNDGTPDGDEWYDGSGGDEFCSNSAGLDTDGDTILNCQDNDVDGDGIPNYQDTDSDNDGTPDSQESRTTPNPSPFGHGDVPAWIDPIYHLYLPLVLRNSP